MRTRFVRPTPAAGAYARRRGQVLICRLADGAEVDRCHGPDQAGRCPRALDDGTVPCAGQVLALPLVVRGSWAWHIPAAYRTCFLGTYDLHRQLQ